MKLEMQDKLLPLFLFIYFFISGLFFNETAKTVKLMFVTQDAVTMDKAEEELMNHYRKTIVVSQFDVPDLERWQEDFVSF